VEGGEGVGGARGTVAAHQCPARWRVEGAREAGEAAPGCGGRPLKRTGFPRTVTRLSAPLWLSQEGYHVQSLSQ
jgi:hypothetical protein